MYEIVVSDRVVSLVKIIAKSKEALLKNFDQSRGGCHGKLVGIESCENSFGVTVNVHW